MLKPFRESWRYAPWLAVLLSIGLAGASTAAETALDRYVAKPDSNYAYRQYSASNRAGYNAYFLSMTSQQWRSTAEVDRPIWQHEIIVVIPQVSLDSTDTAILLIDGGDNIGAPIDSVDQNVGLASIASGAVLAVVRQVPNQPLYFTDDPGRGRQEDEILGYSLGKALDTGDAEWAVHLAMTKAAVRAMDTVQDFAAGRGRTINQFLVLGGSKRGWTTWLTAAVDKRVKAIIPASIDMLNLGQQFVHHYEAHGFYAPALRDYVEFDLPCRLQTPQGQALLRVVDPYAYRDRYTMPKLILNATGDQFFVTDSSRFYYGDLPGPKWLRYTPNTDHKQSEDTIIKTLSWIDDILDNKTSPQITWTKEGEDTLRVIPTNRRPKEVRLWQATNPNARDFRLENVGPIWTSEVLSSQSDGSYLGRVQQPASGWKGFFIEVTFPTAGEIEPDQIYSTGVQIIPDILPFAGQACGGTHKSYLESPQQSSFQSGIGLIRGWICQANKVEVQIDGGPRQQVAYGTTRKDTESVCGDANNGFGYTFNWNSLGNGTHALRIFADNQEFGSSSFTVTTLGQEFLRGASGEYPLQDFPQAGKGVTLRWSEPDQNFVIVGATQNLSAKADGATPQASSLAYLESPQQGSFQSGIGLIRGWICQANTVEIQIDGGERQRVAYGTMRPDTVTVCGDDNNGFGYTFNWNSLGNGVHNLRAFADGVEFGNANFTVTTLGVEFLQGVTGEYPLQNFPQAGKNVTVQWSEPAQNFVIVKAQ